MDVPSDKLSEPLMCAVHPSQRQHYSLMSESCPTRITYFSKRATFVEKGATIDFVENGVALGIPLEELFLKRRYYGVPVRIFS